MMTFEQFQATRCHTDTLADDVNDDALGSTATGFTYLDNLLYIEEVNEAWHATAREMGRYYLLIERDDWIDNDLEKLERILYDYAVRYGLIEEDDTPRVVVN